MKALLAKTYRQFFRHERWNIGIVHEPISAFLRPGGEHTVYWVPQAGTGKYLADPFGIQKDRTVHILCEEFDYQTSKGRIVSLELGHDRVFSRPKIAMEFPYHASYPYLFQHDGEIFCIPETAQAGEISLYKSTHFPSGWKRVATIIDGFAGRDATAFRHEGRWWLTCAGEGDDSFRTLFVWYSHDLYGPWKAHQANPVKKDIGSSRPAGTPFVHEGHLYRPGQDSSRTYGGRIIINRVTKLTPTEFKEEEAAVIEPNSDGPYPDGIHTISSVGDATLLDGKRHVFAKVAFEHTLTQAIAVARHRGRHET